MLRWQLFQENQWDKKSNPFGETPNEWDKKSNHFRETQQETDSSSENRIQIMVGGQFETVHCVLIKRRLRDFGSITKYFSSHWLNASR